MAGWGTAWRDSQKISCCMEAMKSRKLIQGTCSKMKPHVRLERHRSLWDGSFKSRVCSSAIHCCGQVDSMTPSAPSSRGPSLLPNTGLCKRPQRTAKSGLCIIIPHPSRDGCDKALALDTPLSLTPPPAHSHYSWQKPASGGLGLTQLMQKLQEFQSSSVPSDCGTARSPSTWTFSLQPSHSSKLGINFILEIPFETTQAPRTHLCFVRESFNALCWTQSRTWTEETLQDPTSNTCADYQIQGTFPVLPDLINPLWRKRDAIVFVF